MPLVSWCTHLLPPPLPCCAHPQPTLRVCLPHLRLCMCPPAGGEAWGRWRTSRPVGLPGKVCHLHHPGAECRHLPALSLPRPASHRCVCGAPGLLPLASLPGKLLRPTPGCPDWVSELSFFLGLCGVCVCVCVRGSEKLRGQFTMMADGCLGVVTVHHGVDSTFHPSVPPPSLPACLSAAGMRATQPTPWQGKA